MIDLRQREVWFVTGSQDLYGAETLRQVAEHSIGKGSTRIPNFNVVSWVERPAGMDAEQEAGFSAGGEFQGMKPAAQAKAAPAPAVEDDEMF